MCCGDIHIWVQDILETSVQFDGDTNNPNLQTSLAIQNTQRREKKFILSTIRYQGTESLPRAGNDQTTNLREHACKAKWDVQGGTPHKTPVKVYTLRLSKS